VNQTKKEENRYKTLRRASLLENQELENKLLGNKDDDMAVRKDDVAEQQTRQFLSRTRCANNEKIKRNEKENKMKQNDNKM
jgi:hypothetical protein